MQLDGRPQFKCCYAIVAIKKICSDWMRGKTVKLEALFVKVSRSIGESESRMWKGIKRVIGIESRREDNFNISDF